MSNPNRKLVAENVIAESRLIAERAARIWERSGRPWSVCPGSTRDELMKQAEEELRDENALLLDGQTGSETYE